MGSIASEERTVTGWAARDADGHLSPYTYTLRLILILIPSPAPAFRNRSHAGRVLAGPAGCRHACVVYFRP